MNLASIEDIYVVVDSIGKETGIIISYKGFDRKFIERHLSPLNLKVGISYILNSKGKRIAAHLSLANHSEIIRDIYEDIVRTDNKKVSIEFLKWF